MKNKKQLNSERLVKLNNLLSDLQDEFTDDEILKVFGDITDKEYAEYKSIEDIIIELSCDGYCIFKTNSIWQVEQLREYAVNNVFPFYNDQDAAILF